MPLGQTRNFFVAALVILVASPVVAGTISLEWNPADGATGYRVYYGTSPGNYTQSVTVGNTTSTTLTGLANCTNWYVAVKAYNGAGESPEFSNEISGWPCPIVNTPSPSAGIQGSQFTLNIHGSNFQSGAIVEIDNPNVRLDSPTVLSCDQIQVAATIEPTAQGVRAAEVGDFSMTVVNPDDVYGTGNRVFEVELDRRRQDIAKSVSFTNNRIDGLDYPLIAARFPVGQSSCSCCHESCPDFEFDLDINGDGWIDGSDLALVTQGYFGHCWDSGASNWTMSACSSHPSNTSPAQ